MSDGPLPQTVNTRKAVTRGAHYLGVLGGRELVRLADVLGSEPAAPDSDTSVRAAITFSRDEEDRQVVSVDLQARVRLECQRCLEYFVTQIESHSELAIVRTDEEAKQLPARYEPLIATEEVDLWDVVGEELALALPVAPLHPRDECPVALPKVVAAEPSGEHGEQEEEEESVRPNPFEVLSSLLEGEDDDKR